MRPDRPATGDSRPLSAEAPLVPPTGPPVRGKRGQVLHRPALRHRSQCRSRCDGSSTASLGTGSPEAVEAAAAAALQQQQKQQKQVQRQQQRQQEAKQEAKQEAQQQKLQAAITRSGSCSRRDPTSRFKQDHLCCFPKAWGGDLDVLSSLTSAVLLIYERRQDPSLWASLTKTLSHLVPCEEVKLVVRSLGPVPPDAESGGSTQGEFGSWPRQVRIVETWPSQRIEGECAASKRICCIPSSEAERQQWARYEAGHTSPLFCGGGSWLRCMAAVPLLDPEGRVLAVAKFVNRIANDTSNHTGLEFSKTDLAALETFASIFSCLMPSPCLSLPGRIALKAPSAVLELSDSGVGAALSWSLPSALRRSGQGRLIHEIKYATFATESELTQLWINVNEPDPDPVSNNNNNSNSNIGSYQHDSDSASAPAPAWALVTCGVLSRCETDGSYHYRLDNLEAQRYYVFSVRVRNLDVAVDWSDPSDLLTTFLVPPHPRGSEVATLVPRSPSLVDLEWSPFATCSPGLSRVEYRVVALSAGAGGEGEGGGGGGGGGAGRAAVTSEAAAAAAAREPVERPEEPQARQPQDATTYDDDEGPPPTEQVVATFCSDGSHSKEVVSLPFLRDGLTYRFAIEARYPFLGLRTFTRMLVSGPFALPRLPPSEQSDQHPSTLRSLLCSASFDVLPGAGAGAAAARSEFLTLSWQVPSTRPTHDLQVQIRSAGAPLDGKWKVSSWSRLQEGSFHWSSPDPTLPPGLGKGLQVSLRDESLVGQFAVQLRVVLPQEGLSSMFSSWIHPPATISPVAARASVNWADALVPALVCEWQAPDPDFGAPADARLEEPARPVFAPGFGPYPSWFQVRYRCLKQGAARTGEAEATWLEVPALEIGRTTKSGGGGAKTSALHTWRFQRAELFKDPDVAGIQLQVRQGNALHESSWSDAGTVDVALAPPRCRGSALIEVEESGTDGVVLRWPACHSVHEGLEALEYEVFWTELSCGSDALGISKSVVVKPGTSDTATAATATAAAAAPPAAATAALEHRLYGLHPEKRYRFSVTCRYRALPRHLADAAATRLEASRILSRRQLDIFDLLGHPNCELETRYGDTPPKSRFVELDWHFKCRGGFLPLLLSCEVGVTSVSSSASEGEAERPPLDAVLPAMALRRACDGDGDGESAVGGDSGGPHMVAVFWPTEGEGEAAGSDAGCFHACAKLQIPVQILEASLPRRGRYLKLQLRLGDSLSGTWSEWASPWASRLDLAIPPPRPNPGADLRINELAADQQQPQQQQSQQQQRQQRQQQQSQQQQQRQQQRTGSEAHFVQGSRDVQGPSPHGVEAVEVSWYTFEPANPGRVPALGLEYEVRVWRLERSCSASSLSQCFEASLELRRSLSAHRGTSDEEGATLLWKEVVAVDAPDARTHNVFTIQVPGRVFHPQHFYIFQVLAHYVLPDGAQCQEQCKEAAISGTMLLSDPYRPGPPAPSPPRVEVVPEWMFSEEGNKLPPQTALLSLPEDLTAPLGSPDERGAISVLEVREILGTNDSNNSNSNNNNNNNNGNNNNNDGNNDSSNGNSNGNDPTGKLGEEAPEAWSVVPDSYLEVLEAPRMVLVHNLAYQVAQFRIRRGNQCSEASALIDLAPWCPSPLQGVQLWAQMRDLARGQALTGLGVALGVRHPVGFFARLLWPSSPPTYCAWPLTFYQVRFRVCGQPWQLLEPAPVHLRADSSMTECQVTALESGLTYDFSLRLANSLNYWSDWSDPSAAVRAELPTPEPTGGPEGSGGGLKVASVSSSSVKLAWRPFVIKLQRGSVEVPLFLDETNRSTMVEYEVVIKASDGAKTVHLQHGPATLQELQSESPVAWIEADVNLPAPVAAGKPTCRVEVRARHRNAPFGPPLRSPALPTWLPEITHLR